ncbi:DUF4157 domain-containing protein [Alteromonas sp. M12]|uniref:eCIS core domain-containing protein n=1 Tax=Alteromonas sp. M12 TaxID=3135644 RepID=UPI00319E84B5
MMNGRHHATKSSKDSTAGETKNARANSALSKIVEQKTPELNQHWQQLTMSAASSASQYIQRKCNSCASSQTPCDDPIDSFMQPKLNIGMPNDHFEQQADLVAEKVISGSHDAIMPSKVLAKPVQTSLKNTATDPVNMHTNIESQLKTHNSKSPGRPINKEIKDKIEPVIGADLSQVRVHSDSKSHQMAASINAKAFTLKNNIYLGAQQSSTDLGLIAHEATHTVQQSRYTNRIQRISDDYLNFNTPPQSLAVEVIATDISAWDDERKIAAIRQLLNTWWVTPSEENALERLWSSFGERFPQMVNLHITLFRKSYEAGLAITDMQLPVVQNFLNQFKGAAVEFVLNILELSKINVNNERIRYGLVNVTQNPVSLSIMVDSPETQALRLAASQLSDRRAHINRLSAERGSLEQHGTGGNAIGGRIVYDMIRNPDRHEALGRQISEQQEVLNALQSVHQQNFPILAAYAEPGYGNDNALRAIASNDDIPLDSMMSPVAQQVGETIFETLENIAETRERILDDNDVIWELPRIIDWTKRELGYEDGGLQSELVNAMRAQTEEDQAFIDMALGVLALGFGLLAAIPTGGSSLVAGIAVVGAGASLAVNTAIALRSLDQYQLDVAASGSHFEKAQAVSAADPSLLWVAVDIVGAGLELPAARQVFRGAASSIRRAMNSASDEALDVMENRIIELVEQSARAEPGGDATRTMAESIARGIRQKVTQSQNAQSALHRVQSQIDEVTSSLRNGTDDLIEQARLISEIENGAHHLKAAGNGMLIRCSDQCTLIRSFYRQELAEHSGLLARLDAVESAARRAPESPAWRQQARDLVAELKQQRARPIRAALSDSADLDRLLARELAPELSDRVLQSLSDVVASGDFNSEMFQRMVTVIAGTEEGLLRQLLQTQVRINLNTAGDRRVFHLFESVHWDTLGSHEQINMLEAQARGYRVSMGATRRIDTGASGRLIDEAQQLGSANTNILIGDGVNRQGYESILPTRSEIAGLSDDASDFALSIRQQADEAAIQAQAAVMRGDVDATELASHAAELGRRADLAADNPMNQLSRLLTDMSAQRLHASGAGFGIELHTGIAYGPEVVNQIYQNQGIERLIRELHQMRAPGTRFRVHLDLSLTPHNGFDVLERITYRVEMVEEMAGGGLTELRPMFEASITIPQTEIRSSSHIHRGGRNIGIEGIELDVDSQFGALAEHFNLGHLPDLPSVGYADDLTGAGQLHDIDLVELAGGELGDLVLDHRSFQNLPMDGVSLRRAQLRHSDFRNVDLSYTDLRGADLTGANLQGATLNVSRLNLDTTLPDGSPFYSPVDLTRFTDPAHPNFFQIN